MNMRRLMVVGALTGACLCARGERMSLAGAWRFALGETNALSDTIRLPTTTDLAKKGDGRLGGAVVERIHPQLLGAEMTGALTMHPARRFPFVGVARYEREVEIPAAWEGRHVSLFLERTKIVRAFWDGADLGRRDTLAAPAVFELPPDVQPGRHTLRLEIDNRLDELPVSGHQVSDDTQTNWNGVMGRIELRAEGPTRFGRIRLFPDPAARTVGVEAEVISPTGVTTSRQTVALAKDAALWSEFTPVLHEVEVRVGGLSRTMKVGLRSFGTRGTQFTVNGRPTFLRGRHDACVWPLTGAAPMDVAAWRKYFRTLKDYGLNHVRFHSWCPPEAAFAAADELGFYLQPEFACFGGDWSDPDLQAYCLAESKRILDAYGNHPSFVMFSLANEPLKGREGRLAVVEALRAHDPRPLYAQGTNADFFVPKACPGDDFWATFRSAPGAEGNVRGSYANADLPLGGVQEPGGGTTRDFASAIAHSAVPLVGHEVGQYQVYPDYAEIAKWTGPLKPVNLEIFRERLRKAGMADRADAFFRASGALAVLNYREDIEEALRTPGFGGFQLLDIQDFPGQGTALVGILDAFMESKGLVAPAAWRGFCAPTVLLARFPSRTCEAGATFEAQIQVAHYGAEDVLDATLAWRLVEAGTGPEEAGTGPEGGRLAPSARDRGFGGPVPSLAGPVPSGVAVAAGSVPLKVAVGNVAKVGEIRAVLPNCARPARYALELALAGRAERNVYPLWAYPRAEATVPEGVAVVKSLEEGERLLAEGRKVLCVLSKANAPANAVEGTFASDFWNWQMFKHVCESNKKPVAPGTLGLLIDAAHPALAGFPTAFHSDFQWREMLFCGVNVVLDGDPDAKVIVQGIDNVTRNHRLGVIWEKRRGAGRLVVSALDLDACARLPEARALRRSLLDYLARDAGADRRDAVAVGP